LWATATATKSRSLLHPLIRRKTVAVAVADNDQVNDNDAPGTPASAVVCFVEKNGAHLAS